MIQLRGGNGKYLTRQLFHEEYINLPMEQRIDQRPLFSLHKDREGLINFGRAYVESRDPSGYAVSQAHLADYAHWQALLTCRWFLAAKELWDREMDAALVSEAMTTIREMAKEGMPAQRLAAAKYLANKEYRKDKTAGKGRPTKEAVEKAAKELAATDRDIEDDLARIRKAN